MNRSSRFKGNGQDDYRDSERNLRFAGPPFPVPTTATETRELEKRRSPLRRIHKLNLFSKLFSSASRRDLKNSIKTSRDNLREENQGSSKHSATIKTATSSTTLQMSHDAAQVFTHLRRQKQFNQRCINLNAPKSERSLIGSFWDVPSLSSSKEDTLKQVHSEESDVSSPLSRPRDSPKAASFRVPQSARNVDMHRAPSTRSLSYDTKPPARDNSDLSPHVVPVASNNNNSNNNSNTTTIEISPGHHQVLRGHQETLRYVREDRVASTECLFCNDSVYAVNDAAMVFCPNCRSITPLNVDGGNGLALGFSGHEWLSIQREALNMN
jgi:hypothetical protein